MGQDRLSGGVSSPHLGLSSNAEANGGGGGSSSSSSS